MPEDRNKIAQNLTLEELDALITELASRPGKERTLENIKGLAAKRGITISLMSAKAFRDTTFERHLEKIRLAQDVAQQVENIEQGGNTLADASAKLLSKRIFSRLIEAGDDDEVDVEGDSKALARLRSGDVAKGRHQAQLKELEMKLRDFRRREEEREEKLRAASVTVADPAITDAEREARLREIFNLPPLPKGNP